MKYFLAMNVIITFVRAVVNFSVIFIQILGNFVVIILTYSLIPTASELSLNEVAIFLIMLLERTELVFLSFK